MTKPFISISKLSPLHRSWAVFGILVAGLLTFAALALRPGIGTNSGFHASESNRAATKSSPQPTKTQQDTRTTPHSILISSPRQLVSGAPLLQATTAPILSAAAPRAAPNKQSGNMHGVFWLLLTCALLAGSWYGFRKFKVRDWRANLPLHHATPTPAAPKSPTDTQVLRHAYGELKDAFDKEEERMRQLVHLDALSRRLQRCASTAELTENVARCAQGIFPGCEGALFLHAEGERFGLSLAWGDASLVQSLKLMDCHALHSGQNYSAESPGPMACAHVRVEGPYVCLPLLAGSGLIGMLYLARLPQIGPRHMTPWAANAIAERAAIGLTALRRQEQWRQRAVRDGLTGLFNRGFMEESLGIEMQRALRQGTNVGVMLIDVDHFKRYNDSFGHAAGDALLRGFGKLLQSAVREGDMACRYGGEEFVLILPGADLTQTKMRAQALCQAIARWQPKAEDEALERVTASFGVACYPTHGDTWQDVLKQADTALYAAKDAGRNQVCAAHAHAAQAELI